MQRLEPVLVELRPDLVLTYGDVNSTVAAADCTPMTVICGRTVFATMHAPAAPLPPPIGTMMTSISGWSSRISRVAVPTPAISNGSFASDS